MKLIRFRRIEKHDRLNPTHSYCRVKLWSISSEGHAINVRTIRAEEFEKLRAEFEQRGYVFEEVGG